MSKDRQYKVFEQYFSKPLKTSHGTWSNRSTLVLRERRENAEIRYGEVAPTPGFTDYKINDLMEDAKIWAGGHEVSDDSPLNCALSCMDSIIWNRDFSSELEYIHSSKFFSHIEEIGNENITLKKKIGLLPTEQEIKETINWIHQLPESAKVRLDPNQSLDFPGLLKWVKALEGENRLEFIEEPFGSLKLDELIELVDNQPVRIALDERVVACGGPKKLFEMGWSGCFVIKPTLLQDWDETINFIKQNPTKSVISTVFESPFGYEAVIRCSGYSKRVPGLERAVLKKSAGELIEHHTVPLKIPSLKISQLNELWKKIP